MQKAEILPPIHFTIVAGILFVVSGLIYMVTFNWGEAKPQEEIAVLMVGPAAPGLPGWKNYKLQSGVLIVLTVMLVIAFW